LPTNDALSEYIGLVIVLFLLSMICERLADFLKSFLSEANSNNGIGLWLRKLLRIGNLLQKSPPGSINEERRAYRILKINLFCGFFTAWALHADLFSIVRYKNEPFKAIGWKDVLWPWEVGFHWDIAGGLVFIIGCFATGFFISFGSKFWHDMLDLLYNVKNIKRALLDTETFKADNVEAIERRVRTTPSSFINAAFFEAKQRLMVNKNVKAVCLKNSAGNYYFEVSVQQPDLSIDEFYVYFIEPGNGQSIPMETIVLGNDVIRAHSANLSSKVFAQNNPDNFGTFGCLVKNAKSSDRKKFILTCCHNVLNPSIDLPFDTARKVQVCAVDQQTIVGNIVKAERDEEMDASLIEVSDQQFKDIINFLPGIGEPADIRSVFNADVNKLSVALNGAKSKSKRGKVVGVFCDIQVTYSEDEFKLINLIAISNNGLTMSEGGDSGSVVMDADNNIIGLVVAGNSQQTFLMPIDVVFKKLKVELIKNNV